MGEQVGTTATHVLYALTEGGPHALAPTAGAATVHELLDVLPGGVYSALRTFAHNRFLWLDAHFERTERSMRALGWNEPLDRTLLRAALHATTSAYSGAYSGADSRVRFDVLAEPAELQGVRARMFLALSPYVPVPPEYLRDGVRVELAPHLARKAPRVKTTAFVRERRPLPLGTRECYEHILMDEQRRALECSSSNLAFVRDGEVLSAGDGVLEGITALVVRHVAASLGVRWRDERVALDELARIDEAFLTSSSRGLVGIVDIAGARIGDGRVGPLTRRLSAAYYEFAEREARPALES